MPRPKGRPIPESHREKVRQSILLRQAWVNETIRLREAVDADDEKLAVLLVRNILRDRRKASAA
jgi:hypothetical protein